MEYSSLFFYFPATGSPITLNNSATKAIMKTAAPDWKEWETAFGILFTENHPWKVSVNELGEAIEQPPILQSGQKLIWNETASSFFRMEIYGSCFLKSETDRMPELTVAIIHRR
jgi:hypothetical protein